MLSLPKVTRAANYSGYRFMVAAIGVLLVFSSFLYLQQQASGVRFINRSLYINSSLPGVTTFYTITFTYPSSDPVGSVRMLFCTEAIPTLPCDTPTGMDVSGAVLSTQTGATGYTVTSQTQNEIVISRPSIPTGGVESKYTFTNVVNPTAIGTFYIRLTSYATTDASGPYRDYGSIASSTTQELSIDTQVPPILIFCTGQEIPAFDCADVEPKGVDEYEEPSPEETMYDKTEMMAYTNARNGYVITYVGRSLTSGIYELPAIEGDAEESIPGKAQFGINLAVNTEPNIGAAPVGPAANAYVNPDYSVPDMFQFNPGEALVTSDFVTLNKKFTVSYIVNIPPDLHPGVYNTTVTFICTGNF